MKHRANPKFWRFYAQLPEEIQRLGDQNYDLLNDPNQSLLPSLLLTFLVRHDKSLRLVLPDGCMPANTWLMADQAPNRACGLPFLEEKR